MVGRTNTILISILTLCETSLLDRLDPETGREINQLAFAKWTIEEVEAYLDYHDQLDHIAEEQEERRGRYLGVHGCNRNR